jgi:hypothetical protein
MSITKQQQIHTAAQALGRLGGLAKSEAKAKAVRENGNLGGRPLKPSIYENKWGNWYGYVSRKRVIAFSDTPTQTQEQAAKAWLAKQRLQINE